MKKPNHGPSISLPPFLHINSTLGPSTALPPRITPRLPNRDTALVRRRIRPRRIDDAALNVAREAEEGLFHVDVSLCRDLHKGDAELVGERLALLGRDGSLLLPVALVANQDLVDALGRVLLDV